MNRIWVSLCAASVAWNENIFRILRNFQLQLVSFVANAFFTAGKELWFRRDLIFLLLTTHWMSFRFNWCGTRKQVRQGRRLLERASSCVMSGHAHSDWMAHRPKHETIRKLGLFGQNRRRKWANWKIQCTFWSLNIRHCRCVCVSCRIVLRSAVSCILKRACSHLHPLQPVIMQITKQKNAFPVVWPERIVVDWQFGWWWRTWRLPRYLWCNNMQFNKRSSFEHREMPMAERNERAFVFFGCSLWSLKKCSVLIAAPKRNVNGYEETRENPQPIENWISATGSGDKEWFGGFLLCVFVFFFSLMFFRGRCQWVDRHQTHRQSRGTVAACSRSKWHRTQWKTKFKAGAGVTRATCTEY